MGMETKNPHTLTEAIKYFADPTVALNYFVAIRWPKGVTCPHCGSQGVSYLAKQNRWQCHTKHAKRQFSAKVGTVFEDSPLSLEKWLVTMWVEVNAKNSISSCELARALGVTQKSAWFMLHRVRFALKRGSFEKMGRNGVPVEADETFIGGRSEFMHKKERARKIRGGGPNDKTVVMGLLERHTSKKHSTVRAMVLPKHPNQYDIHEIIHKNVEPGAHLMTDEHAAYKRLYGEFEHQFVDHASHYAEGIVHTNGLENFWALFKRCIKGTHISIEPFHLAAYLDSEAFRFNNRKANDSGRFLTAMPTVVGKRLTYKTLIGVTESEGLKATDKGAGSADGQLPN
jgi:transposase-like protein